VTEAPRHAWSHVSCLDILRSFDNEPRQRPDGSWVCGHEPVHASSTNSCLTVDTDLNLWFCSSCQEGGSSLALAVSLLGEERPVARQWLRAHFGAPPAERRRARSKRRVHPVRHFTATV
jgi:hypothetical protein